MASRAEILSQETLNAVTEYTSDENEGTQHRINQYVIKDEIGRGSYGAVHLGVDQYGNEFVRPRQSTASFRHAFQMLIEPHLESGTPLGIGIGLSADALS